MSRLSVRGLDPAGAPDGYAPIVSGGKFILDDPGGGIGLPWFVATAYGADEAGTTAANRAALNALIDDLNAAGHGVFYVDGRFGVDTGLTTITARANIFGDGAGDLNAENAASCLTMDATTGYLLTLAGDGTILENLGFENPTTTTQTAGAAVYVAQGDCNRYRNVSVRGFFDNFHVEDGQNWKMSDCNFVGPVNYGLLIRHADLPDGGDMTIEGCYFYASDRDAVAGIRWESGGGLKLLGNKFNSIFNTGNFVYGLDASFAVNTAVLVATGNSFENVTGPCLRGQLISFGSFTAATIDGNEFAYYSSTTSAAVDITSWTNVTVVGNTMIAQFGGSTQAAVKLTDVDRGAVGLNTIEGFAGGELSQTSCTGITTGGGVPTSRLVSAGTGLSGGGDLSADRTLSIDTSAEAERVQDIVGAMVVAGANITATYNDSLGTLTIAASGGGSGELLMQDGATGPPVPIENEARSDWLYQG